MTESARPLWVPQLWLGLITPLPALALAFSFYVRDVPALAVVMTVLGFGFLLYALITNILWKRQQNTSSYLPAAHRSTFQPTPHGTDDGLT